jgi:hypothetical protein
MGLSQFRGGKKSKKVEEDSSSDEDVTEAFGQGRHLYSHLHGLHGSGYAEDFRAGMSGGSRTGATEGQGKLTITHGGASTEHYQNEIIHVNDPAVARRKGRSMGGRKTDLIRPPMGMSDGRSRRGAIVRKVMAEKKLSMIEASKYVKAHNLYKK